MEELFNFSCPTATYTISSSDEQQLCCDDMETIFMITCIIL